MSLIFANWFKPPSEEATEGEGGASSSSTRDDAGASSSSSVHVDGWRLPRPSEGVRSRRESRDLHAWPAPTPTPHTPSLLHRSGGLPGLLTAVCLHPPTLERLSLRARANGRACRSLAPTSLPPACVSRADQHLSCQNPSPSPSPSPSPTLQQTTLRSPSPTLQQTSLRRRGSSRASSCNRWPPRYRAASRCPTGDCSTRPTCTVRSDPHGSLGTRAAARAGLCTRHPPPRCNHATQQPPEPGPNPHPHPLPHPHPDLDH